MDPACLEYCLTDPEREEFEKIGIFVVEEVLPPRLIVKLSAGRGRRRRGAGPRGWADGSSRCGVPAPVGA